MIQAKASLTANSNSGGRRTPLKDLGRIVDNRFLSTPLPVALLPHEHGPHHSRFASPRSRASVSTSFRNRERAGGDIVELSFCTFGLQAGGKGVFVIPRYRYVEGVGVIAEGTGGEVVMVDITRSCVMIGAYFSSHA